LIWTFSCMISCTVYQPVSIRLSLATLLTFLSCSRHCPSITSACSPLVLGLGVGRAADRADTVGGLSDAVDSIEWAVVKIGNKGRSEEDCVDGACGCRGEFRLYVYRIALRLVLMLVSDRLGGINKNTENVDGRKGMKTRLAAHSGVYKNENIYKSYCCIVSPRDTCFHVYHVAAF